MVQKPPAWVFLPAGAVARLVKALAQSMGCWAQLPAPAASRLSQGKLAGSAQPFVKPPGVVL